MSENADIWHAFADGSAFLDKSKFGIGGVIVRVNGRPDVKFSFSKRLEGKNNSLSCEVKAISKALSLIPVNSNVIVHTDVEAICRHINGKTLKDWFETNKNGMRKSIVQLAKQISVHNIVHANYTNDRQSALLLEAHHQARAGALAEEFNLRQSFPSLFKLGLTESGLAVELGL